ncbi:hypothetical protein AB4Z52_17850 [Rhizobium sp. 2YAF20]|uniref:hypothetical protein n=1 Tax=Rhizobium sp. 2YAF20 TaxID=3233027 RepID=UPI003F968062
MPNEKLINNNVLLRRRMLDKLREMATAPAPENNGEAVAIVPKPPIKRRKATRTPGLYVTPGGHGGQRSVFRKKKNQDGTYADGEKDKGSKSERGFTIFNGHQVQHESFQEHKVSCIFQADPTVADIFSQQPRVDYTDEEGNHRFTIFDFLVIDKSGKRIGVAVKEEEYREEMEAMFDMIAETSEQTVIDEAVFVSGEQATLRKYNNALDILWAREHAQHTEVELVVEMLVGRVTIQFWELYDRAFMGNWKRKAAIWDLIDREILKPTNEDERINDLTRLTVNF